MTTMLLGGLYEVETRAAEGDAAHEALRRVVCVPTRSSLWGVEVEFTPALSSTIWGDGRTLLYVGTCNQRPRYWVVRIDSSWAVAYDCRAPDAAMDVRDVAEDILCAIEDEFGRWDDDDDDDGDQWPAASGEGCHWGRMEWPADCGLATVPHPWSWKGNLLAEVAP